MRLDHLVLIEKRQPAGRFQNALNHEHHVGAAGVVFVEAQRDVVLQRPRQNAVAELGHLHALADHDGVLADEIDAADVAVEIDPHARPVEPRRHLLDVGRLPGAVIASDDNPAVPGKAGENRERGCLVEPVVRIGIGYVLVGLRVGRNLHVTVDPEQLADRNLHVRQAGLRGFCLCLCCDSHCSSVPPERLSVPISKFACARRTLLGELRNHEGHWQFNDSSAVFRFEGPVTRLRLDHRNFKSTALVTRTALPGDRMSD